jgi:AraC-like DNA-binding protein
MRPDQQEQREDIVSDVLGAVHLETRVFGRLELGAPWAIRVPPGGDLFFYVLARGGAWLELEGTGSNGPAPIALSAGDVVLLRHRGGHVLRDDGRSPVLHAPAGDARTTPQLTSAAQLILAESASPGPGSSMLSARLAEILLIHAMRARVRARETGDEHCPGLCALADPAIGTALKLLHARLEEDWTVERLATEVAMSRSAFAAKFAELVGVPPLQYLTRWRMTEAARRLRESEETVAQVADGVGYANAAAFMKAFTRVHGVGPGTYRRQSRRRTAVEHG